MSITAVPLRPIAKGSLSRFWVGIAAVTLVSAGLAWAGVQAVTPSPTSFLARNASEAGVVTTASGLQYKVLKDGRGGSPKADDVALVAYRGTLVDGTVFDENEQAAMPIDSVVPGFSEALQLMKSGGEYQIFIPPQLAYGSNVPEGGPIPPDSVLIFNVKMLDFKSREEIMQMQRQMEQMQSQGGAPAPIQP